MSDNTRTVSPNKAKNAIRHAMLKKRPLFLWGPPGIGKSDIVAQICESFTTDWGHLIEVETGKILDTYHSY